MGGHHGTVGLVRALKALVHVREKGVKSQQVPLDKLSVEQFVHCLAFLAVRCESKDVTLKMRANMWNPKKLEKQGGKMRGDELWPDLAHVPGVDMRIVKEMWEESRDKNAKNEGVVGSNSGTSLCSNIFMYMYSWI